VPDPSNIDPGMKNLFIFDDIATEKNQNPADNFYTRGRHNCSSVYLSQTITYYQDKPLELIQIY
jgi:hypothetical protein